MTRSLFCKLVILKVGITMSNILLFKWILLPLQKQIQIKHSVKIELNVLLEPCTPLIMTTKRIIRLR